MGWGFWELSGGADFRPSQPLQKKAQVAQSLSMVSTVPSVTAQQLAKTNLTEASSPAVAAQLTQEVIQIAQPGPTSDVASTGTQPQTVASLSNAQLDGLQAFQTPESASLTFTNFAEVAPNAQTDDSAALQDKPTEISSADLRRVRGSRVNMRGGPGTSYSVLGVLTKGQQVEVLRGNDSGWVKLRDQDSGQVGWMAAKMLEEAAN